MAILLPTDIIDFETIKTNLALAGNCTHPAGHCFGSDGGSGIPNNLKVKEGQGGNKQVWELNSKKTKVLSKAIYSICQYCLKYLYVQETEDSPKVVEV